MAYTFNDIAKKFSISPAQVQVLEEAGVSVQVLKTCLKFSKGGEVLSSVPVSEATLESVMSGNAGAMTTKALKDNLSTALKLVLSETDKGASPLHEDIDLMEGDPHFGTPIKPAAKSAKDVAKAVLAEQWPEGVEAATPDSGLSLADILSEKTGTMPAGSSVPIFDTVQMQHADRVKLAHAQSLYQPVRGSDSDSRYFCVAWSPSLKAAARYLHGKLSVRFEGDLVKHKSNLAAAGITVGQTHASLHLHASDDVSAAKALGAVLASVGANFSSLWPQISVIKNKGS